MLKLVTCHIRARELQKDDIIVSAGDVCRVVVLISEVATSGNNTAMRREKTGLALRRIGKCE